MTTIAFSVGRSFLSIVKCCSFLVFFLISLNLFSQQSGKTGPFIPQDSSSLNLKDSLTVDNQDSTTLVAGNDSLQTDTTKKVVKARKHSPLKAALFSLAVPGLGQAYNKKYWKIPIVYAGFGGLSYAIYHTASNFHGYRRAYRAQVADPPDFTASYKGVDDRATLKSYRDYYKRYLDISIICFALWDVLNIVDATVDAHLFEWNMRDDLSVSWKPAMVAPPTNYSSAATGVQVQLRF